MCIEVYDVEMSRTNIVIDDELVERAMRLYNLKTKREAVDLALRRLVGVYRPIDILDLEGMGWEGDLEELRRDRIDDLWSS
jgi:Arc/MetJ family transcription regulator